MFKQVFMFCIIAVLLGLGARIIQLEPVPFWGFPKPLELIQPKPLGAAELVKTEIDEAFAPSDQAYAVDYATCFSLYGKRKKENIQFVDARAEDLYAAGHIPGATNIPFEFLDKYAAKMDALPKDNLIVIYCDGGDCHLSHDLAEYALASGWTRLAVFEGGWAEWTAESDFIATGPDTQQE
jgi:rhodanese-related sulfurtransferase